MSNISTLATKLFALLFLFSSALSAQIFTEDFDGALPATWTAMQADASPVNATSNWFHTTVGSTGAFAIGGLESTSAANGYMIYDSDLNCSGNQDAWLISPAIDCSTYPTNVFLQFETYYRKFDDVVYIEVSNDNMMTWTEIEAFPGIGNNDFAGDVAGGENPVLTTIDISAVAAGQSTVHFAFRFLADATTGSNSVGCGYSWMLDDVALTDVDPTPLYDMRANANFYAIYNNALTPASQLTDMGFLCDIENIGQLDAPEVNLNVSIVDDATMATVHTQDLSYGTVPAGTLDENRIFQDRFTPTGIAGTLYTGSYSVTMNPADLAPGNNEQTFQFLVTDSTFAKEGGTGFAVTTPAAETSAASTWATCYNMVNTNGPNGDQYACTSIQFEVGNAATIAGATVNATLYKWVDVNDNGVAEATERNGTVDGAIVGNASYTIGAGDGIVTLALENWDDDSQPVWLEGGNNYMIAVAFSPTGTDKPTIVGTDAFDYGAMVFLNDSLDINLYNTFWNVNDVSFDADLNPLGFAPRIRMNINEVIPVNTEDILSTDNKVEIYPNPVVDMVTLDLDLVELTSEANVRITDATGKVVMERFYENIQNEKFQYQVDQFAAGTYFLNFTTEAGNRTLRFIVAK